MYYLFVFIYFVLNINIFSCRFCFSYHLLGALPKQTFSNLCSPKRDLTIHNTIYIIYIIYLYIYIYIQCIFFKYICTDTI